MNNHSIEIRNGLNGVQYLFYNKETKQLDIEIFFHTKLHKYVRDNFKVNKLSDVDFEFSLMHKAYYFGKMAGIPVSIKS